MASVEGAYVNLYKDGEIFKGGFTGSDGNVYFDCMPQSAGDINIVGDKMLCSDPKVKFLMKRRKKEDQCASILPRADRPEVPYEVDF